MKIQCYGRTYEADGDELRDLLRLLEGRELALANRWRVGVTWPRGRKVENRAAVRPHLFNVMVELACGGSIDILGDFKLGDMNQGERKLLSAISDAIREYKNTSGPATSADAVDPQGDSNTGTLPTRAAHSSSSGHP